LFIHHFFYFFKKIFNTCVFICIFFFCSLKIYFKFLFDLFCGFVFCGELLVIM